MPEIADVIPGEDVDATWGNLIRSRTLQRYASEAVRSSQNPSPQDGDLSYVSDIDSLEMFTDGAWVPYAPKAFVDAQIAAALAAANIHPDSGEAFLSGVLNTTSATYVDLGGPSVTIEVSRSTVIALFNGHLSNDTIGGAANIAMQCTGANTVGPSDNAAMRFTNNGAGSSIDAAYMRVFDNMVPGTTTFQPFYRRHVSGSATFARAQLVVYQV